MFPRCALAAGVLAVLIGCGADSEDDGTGAAGAGASAAGSPSGTGGSLFGDGGAGTGGGNDQCGNELKGVLRDFTDAHPDFEGVLGTDKGIVLPDLGADLKPVYAGMPDTPTTNGQAAFDQWFRDVDGVNQALPLTIQLTESNGVLTYQTNNFFPIDDQLFGNQGRNHNYHFTYEIHASFTYEGGEVFTFTGDDDVFTYVNRILAIDLGGVHGAQSETIDLDAQASQLGITVGETYPLDFFFAERHTTESNFRIDTAIACFTDVPPPQ